MPHDNIFPHLWRSVCQLDEQRRAVWEQLTTPEAIRARQGWVRERVQAMIGPFPERCDLNARVTNRFERDGYRVESLIFDSRPNWPVTATLYVPQGREGERLPAVVSPCGHSANGRMMDVYQRAHIGLARQGFVVLSYDPVSQGERNQYLDHHAERPELRGCCHQHCMAGNQLDLVGYGFANIRIWDGIRALDYLLGRAEVDPARVAVTGNSGGGTLSTYLYCLDERYAAGSPGCFITTLVHRIATRYAADSEQQFPPMLKEGIDHADLLLAGAPRPLLIAAAAKDFFPIEGARRTYEDLQRIYAVLGAPGDVGMVVSDNPHGWTQPLREGLTQWFNRHLRGDSGDYAEPDIAIEDDATLYATETGQVMTADLGAIGLHELVVRDHPVPLACREGDDPAAEVRAKLPDLLGIDPAQARQPWPRPWLAPERVVPPPTPMGVRVEAVRLLSDFDVELFGWLLKPAQANGRAELVVPDEEGIAGQMRRGSLAYELVAEGTTVLTVDPRGVGTGKSDTPDQRPATSYYDFYGTEVEMTYTSWMIGRPLLGMRVFDMLCCAHWLRGRGLPMGISGVGTGALVALLAGALDDGIETVRVRDMLASWRSLFESEVYDYLPSVFLPGVLRYFDLPDVAATLAPRPLTLDSLVDAQRRPLSDDAVRAAYGNAAGARETAGARG